MTVEGWVFEAVEAHKDGATVRDVQRYIDERRYEELAVDTIEEALDRLTAAGRLERDGARWMVAPRISKEDALKRLFGDG